MNVNTHALQSSYRHKLDPSCRFSVPSDWRDGLRDGDIRIFQTKTDGIEMIRVLTQAEFEAMITSVEELPAEEWSRAKKKKMLGRFHASVQVVTMNDQGKMQLPKAWCERPGIKPKSEIQLVGRGTYFEIFSLENYQKVEQMELEGTEDIDAELGFFS